MPIPSNFDAWRRETFPVFNRKIFLTHASVSALPAPVVRAIADYATACSLDGQWETLSQPTYERCKERVARLIGPHAAPDEVAFAGSTSHALGLVATSFGWQAGDNCIVGGNDFPANVTTWKNLEHTHGVEVRLLPPRDAGDWTPDDLVPLVDERTRIVSLCSANFLSGCPLDLDAFGQWLHARGILFCVDAIQTLGAIRGQFEHVDFVCADAHKWLLGPNGIAVLWARREVMQTMRPMILGWLASQNRDSWFAYDTTPHPTAERFEPGARNYLGIAGLDVALGLLEEIGPDEVESRVVARRDEAARALRNAGCKLLWEPDARRSGIVSFQPPQDDAAELASRLEERFALSLRQDRHGAGWIRVSPHFMNTRDDIEALAAAVRG